MNVAADAADATQEVATAQPDLICAMWREVCRAERRPREWAMALAAGVAFFVTLQWDRHEPFHVAIVAGGITMFLGLAASLSVAVLTTRTTTRRASYALRWYLWAYGPESQAFLDGDLDRAESIGGAAGDEFARRRIATIVALLSGEPNIGLEALRTAARAVPPEQQDQATAVLMIVEAMSAAFDDLDWFPIAARVAPFVDAERRRQRWRSLPAWLAFVRREAILVGVAALLVACSAGLVALFM